MSPPFRLSVLIPSYRRPEDLKRCLAAISEQQREADEIIVVVRTDDIATLSACREYAALLPALKVREVSQPGQVFALNAGLEAAAGDIICITDDDAAPYSDWLQRIETVFMSDPQVGGAGGRDHVHQHGTMLTGELQEVGIVQWYGRVIGNHHLGAGTLREVDLLKGANMSYRRAAIAELRFDSRLRGSGAQVCNDMCFSLSLKRRGWKIVYDPAIRVDHFPASRFDEDGREAWNRTALSNAVHNETIAIASFLPPVRRLAFLIWSIVVGTSAAPGMLQGARLLARGEQRVMEKVSATLNGRLIGWRTWLAQR